MSVDMDDEEVTSEMNVELLFNSQNTQDESSSSIEFPLNECDSGKKVTMSSLNEKLMSMWDFLQQQNEKQKKHKVKLSQALHSMSSNFAQNQDELKQTVSQNQDELKQNQDELRLTLVQNLENHTAKLHDTLSIQTKAVYAAIETQNQKIEDNFNSQKTQLDADLNSFKEDNSKRFHRVEANMQKINVAFSERDRILSETNSRVQTIMNERDRHKRENAEVNEHIEKLFVTVKAHEQANHQLEGKIVRVESASNICELKCDKIENSLSKMSHTVNEKIDELQSNLCKEIQNRSKEFCDVNDKLERISDQVKSIRDDVEVGTYQPAEGWNVRNSKISDGDIEGRIENFHDRVHRSRSFSCSGNVPWDLDLDDNESVHAKQCIDDDDVENRFSNHVRFNDRLNDFDDRNSRTSCVKESILKSKSVSGFKTFSDEINDNCRLNVSPKVNDHNEIDVFARMMDKIVAKTNNVPLPVFDGVNVELESYRRQCLAVAKQNDWNSVDLAIRIISSLQGDARSLMNLLPAGHEYDLDSIWNILKSRFDRPLSPELAKNQLANLQQKRGETFLHLSLQIEKLINRAYPLANEPMRQQLLLDHFIKSIANSAVRYEIRLKNPRDINQAKQMAEEISAIQMSEKFQRLTYVNKISCRNRDDSGSSSDEEEEERKKSKSKVSQKEKSSPHSLSQKQNSKSTVNMQRESGQPKVRLQSDQADKSNYVQNNHHLNQNYHAPAPRYVNRDFKQRDDRRKFQSQYQESYVQPQQYPGYSPRRQYNGDGRKEQWSSNQRNDVPVNSRGVNRNDYGNQRGRGRSRWFNRQNLENLYHGDDVRKGNGQRTLRSVSR
jgi:hypothetical protein